MKNLLVVMLCMCLQGFAQDTIKGREPILYGGFTLGGGGGFNGGGGLLYGAELNHQFRNNLLTLRFLEQLELKSKVVMLFPFVAMPVVEKKSTLRDLGVLYGRRWIFRRSSLSVSGGVSVVSYTVRLSNEEYDHAITEEHHYFGVPLEVSYIWFKAKKKRFRIAGIVPVGKPTAFGADFGYKLVANISNHSYIGFGLVIGLGIHKVY